MIPLILGVFAFAVPVAFAFMFAMRASIGSWKGVWERVGQPYGLSFERDELRQGPGGGFLGGTVRERPVVVISHTSRSGHTVTVCVGEVQTGRYRLELGREGLRATIEKLLGARELDTGDPTFDRSFYVHTSDAPRSLAVLSAPLRARLVAARPDAVEVVEGQVRVEYRGFGLWHGRTRGQIPKLLHAAIEGAVDLAEAVEAKHDIERDVPPTRRPTLARFVGPALTVVGLAALLGGVYALRVGLAQHRAEVQRERAVDFRRHVFALDLLAAVEQHTWTSYFDMFDSSNMRELLEDDPEALGRHDESRRQMQIMRENMEARYSAELDGLRRAWSVIAEKNHLDPAIEALALREKVAELHRESWSRVDAEAIEEALDQIFSPVVAELEETEGPR